MNNRLRFGLLVIFVLSMLCLLGCRDYPKELAFLDFPQYANFRTDVESIVVNWDNNDGQYVDFIVNDASNIERILDTLVNKTRFISVGAVMLDGGNGFIVIKHQDQHETVVMLNQLQYGTKKQYYVYDSSCLYDIVNQIGKDLGVAI